MIADFLIRIAADGKSFFPTVDAMNRETRRLTSAVSGFQNAMTALGGIAATVGVTRALSYLDQVIEKADRIKDTAGSLEIDQQLFQKLENLLGPEKAVSIVEKMANAQTKINEGGDGAKKLAEAFAQFGITLDDIRNKSHGELIEQMARSVESMAMNAERLSALQDIFGKNPSAVAQAFQKGLDSTQANAGTLNDEEISFLGRAKDVFKTPAGAAIKSTIQDLAIDAIKGVTGEGSAPSLVGIIAKAINTAAGKEGIDPKLQEAAEKLAVEAKGAAMDQVRNGMDRVIPVFSSKEAESRKQADKIASRSGGFSIDSDQLQRIGLFRGGGGDTFAQLLERQQLEQLRVIKGTLSEIKGLFAKE